MKVKQLIKKLNKLDPEMEILTYHPNQYYEKFPREFTVLDMIPRDKEVIQEKEGKYRLAIKGELCFEALLIK